MIQANGRDKNNPGKLLKEKHIGSCLHMIGYECFELQEKALKPGWEYLLYLELMPSTAMPSGIEL